MIKEKGFTLIELIVVMAVFLLIIGTGLGIFISVIQNQRRILARQELLNQTSYFIEQMTKGLRMAQRDDVGDCLGTSGYNYVLGDLDSITGKYKSIKFINASDTDNLHPHGFCEKFCLDDSDPQNAVLKEIKNGGNNGSTWSCSSGVPVTSTGLKINYLSFVLNGNSSLDHVPASESDDEQPRVTIFLDVKAQGDNNQPSAKVQTTISQRNLNK